MNGEAGHLGVGCAVDNVTKAGVGSRGTQDRLTTGIDRLDEVLYGGIPRYSTVFIAGLPGTGKTILCEQALVANARLGRTCLHLALSFLVEAARKGQPGLLVTFEESPNQIARNTQAFGWDLADLIGRELLDVFHVSPSELNIDRHAFAIRKRAEGLGARLVVIDSITAFEAAVPDAAKYQSYVWAINDHFRRGGVTVITTAESRGPFDSLEISTRSVSFVSDNIIFLRYVEVGSEVKRVVGVLKMRGSRHDRHLREFLIEPPRIAVGQALEQVGMLGATVRGRGATT